MLLQYWRLLFHARVHLALGLRAAAGKLAASDVRQRILRLGTIEFDEIRHVLQQEHLLLPPSDAAAVYAEFAAVYSELRLFAPELVASHFPALESPDEVDRLLAEDVDVGELFRVTRPPGVPEPADGRRPAPSGSPPGTHCWKN